MDKERQAVYRAIQQGLLSLADSFQIPRIDGRALSDIFFELRLDHPEIFGGKAPGAGKGKVYPRFYL